MAVILYNIYQNAHHDELHPLSSIFSLGTHKIYEKDP